MFLHSFKQKTVVFLPPSNAVYSSFFDELAYTSIINLWWNFPKQIILIPLLIILRGVAKKITGLIDLHTRNSQSSHRIPCLLLNFYNLFDHLLYVKLMELVPFIDMICLKSCRNNTVRVVVDGKNTRANWN